MTADNEDLIELLRRAIPEFMQQKHTPGLNIAVARGGEVIWEAGFGYADLQRRLPMTPETVFRSGSMGKTYVGTAIMQLVERDIISLDGAVSDYVKFPVVNPLGDRDITVAHLLTHTSGLAANLAHSTLTPPPPLARHLRDDFARGENERYRGAVPKWIEPAGSVFEYSNSGLAMLGLVIEEMNPDGLSIGNYILRYILEPLEMRSSWHPDGNFDDVALVPKDIHDRIGTGYAGWGPLNIASPTIYFKDFPAGYLLSIPSEHIRLLLAYLNDGEYNGNRILDQGTVATMLRPHVDLGAPIMFGVDRGASTMGLTWFRGGIGSSTEWFGHGGAHMWGWMNNFRAYPNLDLAIAIATNRWDLSASTVPPIHSLIEDLAVSHLAGATTKRPGSGRSWAWKRSYAVGLDFIARNMLHLGLEETFDDALVNATVQHAFADDNVGFDRDGFKAAVEDTAHADFTLEGLDAFLNSSACQLSRAELDAIWATVGGIGSFPFPVDESIRELITQQRTPPNTPKSECP